MSGSERRPPGGGAAAGDAAAPAAPNPLAILMQLGFMYVMYTQFSGRNKQAATPKVEPFNPVTTSSVDVASSIGDVPLASVAPPTASPAMPELPSWMPSEMRDMMKVAVESQSGKRNVPAPMAYWEEARTSTFDRIAAGASRLVNVWRPGTSYDVYVYLSESAQPLTAWATEYDQEDWSLPLPRDDAGLFVAGPEASSTDGQSGVAAQWSLMGDSMRKWTTQASQNLGATNPPARQMRNDTFRGLVRVDTSAAEGAGHAPPLFWRARGLSFDYKHDNNVEQKVNVVLSERVKNNMTAVYAHVFMVTSGATLDPSSPSYDRTRVVGWLHPMVRLLQKKPEKVTFNLLSGEGSDEVGPDGKRKERQAARFGIGLKSAEEEEEEQKKKAQAEEQEAAARATAEAAQGQVQEAGVSADGEFSMPGSTAGEASSETAPARPSAADPKRKGKTMPLLPYWKPSLTLETVVDHQVYNPKQLPPNVKSVLQVEKLPSSGPVASPVAGTEGYLPLLHVNDFWTLGHHLVPLNASVDSVPVSVRFGPAPMWRWALQTQMSATWDVQANMGTSGGGDSDMLKSIIMDTNPVLLGITMVVSMLHMVFDFLAFRNDISFWRSAKSLEGLSVRTLTLNLVQSVIIAAYLFNENTSWMILISQVIGLAIEIWKLRKAVAVNLSWRGTSGISAWIPVIDFSDKEESYASSRTKEYDDIATAHLLFILYPLVAGYATYSLFYDRHKSWLSWLLGSLTGFVYTFGFAQMVPQLYINYRLKSVAHMPWRAMVYKALNTFIDDLFAFVVKMPTLHRLSVFRDDIIFFCYLYQRWVYPIDKARKNEYGASALDYEALEARAKGEVRQPRRGKLERRAQ